VAGAWGQEARPQTQLPFPSSGATKKVLIGIMWLRAAITENSTEITQKIKTIPYDRAIPPLGINPKERRSLCWRDLSTPMFIASLFTISQERESARVSTSGLRDKAVCTQQNIILAFFFFNNWDIKVLGYM
jgi:hypothetical protein